MNNSALAKKGRNGDTQLAHLANGETIVPPVISDELRAQLYAEMQAAGIDPNEYVVGEGMSINPETGLPEFGFLKKVGKFVKKVVSNPIVSAALPFVLGPAGLGLSTLASAGIGAGLGALSGNGLKGIASGALGAASSGIGNYLGSGIASATGLSGLASNSIGSALVNGAASKLNGNDTGSALLSGGLSGLGSLYQGGAFNGLGDSFKSGGLSGALSRVGDNISGTGDVLSATGALSPNATGGGASSYGAQTKLSNGNTITWDNPSMSTVQPGTWHQQSNDSGIGDFMSGKGLNSILSAGIGSYSNSKATDQLLKQQKQGLAALQPYLNRQFTPQDLENDPGYQFQLQQGTRALDSANASRGNYFSGDALRSAGAYATGLADQTYNQAFNRDQTQNNANINGILAQYGMLGDIGNTQATSTINQGNILTDSIANYFQPEDPYAALLKKYLGR